MKLTTPYAVLAGFALVALAIASQRLTGSLVPEAWAQQRDGTDGGYPLKVTICDMYGGNCAGVMPTFDGVVPRLWVATDG